MPIALRVTTTGEEATFDFLRELAGRIGDVSTPLRAVGNVMLRSISENFEQEGRPVPWKPLAESTIFTRIGRGRIIGPRGTVLKRAAARLATLKILQDRGFLKAGIHFEVQGNVLRIGPTGPSAVYGRIQQLGGQAGRGHAVTIPARPYLLFQDEDLVEAKQLIRMYVIGREGNVQS